MNKSFQNNQYSSQRKEDSEEINLIFLFNLLNRNRIFIGFFGILFLILSYIFTLNMRKIWEGQFEIVVGNNSSKNNSSSILIDQNLQNLIGFKSSSKMALSTEIGILQSPLVLMPIFEFVNDSNKKNNLKTEDLIFSDWKENNLSINLKKGTSILQVAYKDSNKSIIIPVLNRITNEYQQYSGKTKKRSFQLAKKYLNDQIKKYKLKSSESLKIAQEYAMDEDLTIVDLETKQKYDTGNNNPELPNFNNTFSNIGIEGKRVAAANEIRNIDLQIDKIMKLENDTKQLQYIGSTIPSLQDEGIPKLLENLEREILELKIKFTSKDKSIYLLEQKRELYVKLLKERAIGYLNANRIAAESRMESATRPKGVVTKYKSLMREAGRDENTLIQLENQLRAILLQEARIEEPWELITKPTLKSFPIAPRKLRISLLGMLIGLLVGYILSFYKELRTGYIFEENYLENLLDTKIFQKIDLSNSKINEKEIIKYFEEIIELTSQFRLRILITKNFDENELAEIKRIIPEKKYNIKYTYDLNNFSEDEEILLLSTMKSLTFSEVDNIRNRLKIINKNLFAIFLSF